MASRHGRGTRFLSCDHQSYHILTSNATQGSNGYLGWLGPYIPLYLAIQSVLELAKAIVELTRFIHLSSSHHMHLREIS